MGESMTLVQGWIVIVLLIIIIFSQWFVPNQRK